MFTGIVEAQGEVISLQRHAEGARLSVSAGNLGSGVVQGESVAVNGCCLTAVLCGGPDLGFDLLEETLQRTNLGGLAAGAGVNLERSLRADSRLGGHFVSGHIDATGEVETIEPRGRDVYCRIGFEESFSRWVAAKGSVALDGISLTVAESGPGWLAVWLIPHTLAVTNLASRRPGDRINIEFDLLAKYVERALSAREP